MTDTLTDDLRAAFEHRAHEIPEREAPGLVLGYTATPVARRRWPLVVSGAVAAGLLTVAFVASGSDPTTTTTAESTTTEVPSAVTPEPHDGAFITGEVEGHTWELVSTRTPEGGDDVHLEAEGMEGSFRGQFTYLRAAQDEQGDFLFSQLGPCCRLAGYTMLVGVFAPDVVSVTVTPEHDQPTRTSTAPSPGATDGYRYIVVPIPPSSGWVSIHAHKADGSTVPVGQEHWPLEIVGG